MLLPTDRHIAALRNLRWMYGTGRLAGTGLITGRKFFQKPMKDEIELLNAVQDVYLCEEVTVA